MALPSVLRGAIAALPVRAGEGRRTALLFAHLLLASAIFILGRTVRDTLFLSRYSLSALPWMFVLYGVASAITVVLYARVADKIPRTRLIVFSLGVGMAAYLGTWVAVLLEQSWIYPVFYVVSEVAANLFIVQFWTLANDLNEPRAARRLFPLVGSARVLGVVVIGLATGAIVRAIGTSQLLLVLVGLMALVAFLALRLGREPVLVRAARKAPKGGASVTKDPYVRVLAAFILCTFVVLTLGDYQFKAIARATYQEDELASFFSLFYAGTGVASFVFQVLVTPRLLRRFGVGWGMRVMPGVFGIASAILLFVPHLAVATVMKFADNGFQYTIHETTLQALYVPFPEHLKARTRAFLDAVIKPLSYGAGGLVLVLLASRMSPYWLSAVAAPVVLAWLLVIPLVRRRYVRALSGTLGVRGALALESMQPVDSDAQSELTKVLEHARPEVLIAALGELEGAPPPALVPAIARLAAHPEPGVRQMALRLLAATHTDATPVLAALDDTNVQVRAASIEACGSLLGDGATGHLTRALEDPAPDVRVAALAGLLVHGGVEGAIVAGPRLGELLGSESADERSEAARVLGRVGRAASRPVRALLADPDPRVRREALRAARSVGDPSLVPDLLPLLCTPETMQRAASAVATVGADAVPALLALFDDPSTPRATRLFLPRLFRRIPCDASFEGLLARAKISDAHVRLRIHAGLAGLRDTLGRAPEPAARVADLVETELSSGYARLAADTAVLGRFPDEPLFAELSEQELDRVAKRLLRILQLRYDRRPLDLVRHSLAQPGRRANALELLDGLLEPALRSRVVPWFDDAPVAERLARASVIKPAGVTACLRERAADPQPFAAAVAVDLIGRHALRELGDAVRGASRHAEPWVREAVLVAARALGGDLVRDLRAELASDPSPLVARRARDGEEPMRTTLEKVLLLKGASLFARVSSEDLMPLAVAADERTYAKGETIVREGEVGDALFVILHGRVSVLRGGSRLATLGPGETVGEMAVLDAEPRSATVRADEETAVLVIASEDFYEVLREQVEIAEGVIRTLTRRLREANTAFDPMSIAPPAPDPD